MWADYVPAFLGASTCAISFKHAQYFGCTTCPSSGLKFQLYRVSLCGNMETTTRTVGTLQHKMLCRYWKEGGKQENQHSFICLIFSLLLYILWTDISLFCVLLTAACNSLKNWVFSAQFCISAFGLSAAAIALFSVLLRLSFVLLLHTISLAFMSLYWYAYSFELLLVFTLLCKHAERINIRFQPLVSLWSSHNIQSLRLTPLQCL